MKIFVFFCLLAIASGISGQNREVDSLLRLNATYLKEDTFKIMLLKDIAYKMAPIDIDSALFFGFQAIEISEKLGFKKGLAYAKNSMGVIYYYNNEYPNSFKYYSEAVAIAEEIKDNGLIAVCYRNMGMIDYYLANYQRAIDNYLKSLKIYEQLNDQSKIAAVYNNIAAVYYAQEYYDNALKYYFKAYELLKNLKDEARLAEAYLNIGNCFNQKGRASTDKDSLQYFYDKANSYYDICLEISTRIDDKLNMAYAYNNKGEINRNENNFEKALEYYKLGLKLFEECNEQYGVGVANAGIGGTYKDIKDYNKALPYLLKALAIGREQEFLDIQSQAADDLAVIYSARKMYKEAYEHFKLYHQLDSTIKKSENIEDITKKLMQFDYEKDKLKRELEYQAEMARQRTMRMVYLAGLFIAIIGGIYVYINYKRKQRDNILLAKQKAEIEEAKKSITDSIMYARRIQTAILPSEEMAKQLLNEYFILFRPRDIVSGDFYWMTHKNNKVIVTAADCTGHGVPGAFMSMLGVSFLNEIVNKAGIDQAHLILNSLRESVKGTLDQTGKKDEAKDGMDIALCVIDFEQKKLEFAGAYNSLYYFRNGEFNEVKADRMPIGIYIKEKDSFTLNEVDIQSGDTYYIFSDGYPSQFGGPDGGKLKSSGFKKILEEVQDKPLWQQKEILDKAIDDWRGELEQVDDVLVIGFKIT